MALKIRHFLACGVAIVALPAVAAAADQSDITVASNDSSALVLRHASSAAPVMQAPAGEGAAAPVESVVVTGSRVISDAASSPTPLTIVSTADLPVEI